MRLTEAGAATRERFGLPDLCALATARGWRSAWDPAYAEEDPRFRETEAAWLVRVPCRRGFIAVFGRDTLSALCTRRRSRLRLLELPGVMVVQQGDVEVLVTFGVEDLDDVAVVLEPRRRMRLSPEERARRTARLPQKRGAVASQGARSGAWQGVDSGVGGDR